MSYREELPEEQDPFFGTKANRFQEKQQPQDLKSRLYDKGFKQTTMPSVQRPEQIAKKDNKILHARLASQKVRNHKTNDNQHIHVQKQSIALHSQFKQLDSGKIGSDKKYQQEKELSQQLQQQQSQQFVQQQTIQQQQQFNISPGLQIQTKMTATIKIQQSNQTSSDFFKKSVGFKATLDSKKPFQNDKDLEPIEHARESLSDWKDLDFHQHMHKTSSLFNLPALQHRQKGVYSTTNKFGMSGEDFFENLDNRLRQEPKDFKPIEKKRNKYIIDKFSGKFNIEIRYKETVDQMDGKITKKQKLKSLEEQASKIHEQKIEKLKAAGSEKTPTRQPSKLDTYIDLILKSISNIEEYIYLVKNPKNDDDPYDLQVETYENIKDVKEYYIMSRQGLCYYVGAKPVEFIKLAHWLKERENYDEIKRLNFFTKFRKWKTLKMWKKNVIKHKTQLHAKQLEEKLFILNPILRKTLLEYRAQTYQMRDTLKFIETENKEGYQSDNTFTLETFKNLQEGKKSNITRAIQDTSKKCRNIVRAGFEESLNCLKKGQQVAQSEDDGGNQKKQSQNIFRIKESAYEALGFSDNMNYEKRSELRKECSKFLRFAYLVDFMAMESLSNIFILSVQQLEDKFKNLVENDNEYIVKDIGQKGNSQFDTPLFEINIDIDVQKIEDEEIRTEPLKEFVPEPWGNATIDQFNPLYHVKIKQIKEEAPKEEDQQVEKQKDGEKEVEEEEEVGGAPNEDTVYERRIVPQITEIWLDLKPNRDLFFRELQNCIIQGLGSIQYFERWSKHDDMSKYVMVLEEWDDMVGEDWEAPEATYLNPSDWLDSTPTEIFQDTFKELLDKAFDKCDKWIKKTFQKYLMQFWENQQLDLDVYKEEKLESPGDAFKYTLQKLMLQKEQFHAEIPFLVELGLFRIDTEKLRHLITPNPENIISKFQDFMPGLIREGVKKILAWMEESKKELKGGQSTIEQFVQRNIFLKKCQKQLPSYKNKLKTLIHLQDILFEFKFDILKDDKELIAKARDGQKKLDETIFETEDSTERNIEQFAREVKNRLIPELTKAVQALESEIKKPEYINCSIDKEKAIQDLTYYNNRVLEEEQTSLKIKKYEKNLNISEPSKFEDLEDLKQYSTLLLQLYTASKEWSSLVQGWMDTPFQNIQTDSISRKADEFTKIVSKCSKQLPQNPILTELKSNVNDFKNAMPIVKALRNDNMTEKHMREVYDKIGREINIQDENFTLKNLIELNMMEFVDEIRDISTQATQEKLLIQAHDKVSKEWKELTMIGMDAPNAKKGNENKILTEVDELNTALDALMAEMNSILSSRYLKSLRSKAEDTSGEIMNFIDTIADVLVVQKNWMYLVNIFLGSGDSIKTMLKEEYELFHQVHKFFSGKMKKLNVPLQCHKFIVAKDRQQWARYKQDLTDIQKALDQLLEKKRSAFPRFYFLSNDELLEMLANPDLNSVQKNMKKCFDGIQNLKMADNNILINGMNSPEGEYIQFLGQTNLKVENEMEIWLSKVESAMKVTLTKLVKIGKKDYDNCENRAQWVKDHCAQIVAIVCNIQWTAMTEYYIESQEDYINLTSWYDVYDIQLGELTGLIAAGEINDLQRKSIVALITQDVHARDIIQEMMEAGVSLINDFLWQKQLRYYWDDAQDACNVKQVNATIKYGYEYMGATTRLVITPLTDRCWMTITGALQIKLGAAPAGPAGTGKTESTKDLGKALGMVCVVFNCSDQIEYKMMGKLFAGLSEQGAWACLDEFNRIEVDVLSVIAQQLLQIRQALLQNKEQFEFGDFELPIKLKGEGYGVFITMNPGYAGRTELPDNLKVLFRPVAMMIPDYRLIAEIMLYSEGFKSSKELSRKMKQLYKLSSEQLSQQDHYDFGMRAVKSVLNMAGNLKRKFQDLKEEVVLIRAMRDSNVPKFLKEDLPLFSALINDLFPSAVIPEPDYGLLPNQITQSIQNLNLQFKEELQLKVIQLYETFNVRFGVMLVGQTTSGKTTCYEILKNAMSALAKQEEQNKVTNRQFYDVITSIMNPKCITMGELYGEVNKYTSEWTDGLASKIMRDSAQKDDETRRWIVFDGPVDALWIENMNTVLDDNMMLCLANGQRIKLRAQMRMLFEVQDLKVASPATVSRCGMVYLIYEDLGWRPYVKSWIEATFGNREEIQKDGTILMEEILTQDLRVVLYNLFDNNVDPGIHKIRHSMSEPIQTCDMQLVISLCNVFECFLKDLNPAIIKHDKPENKKRFMNYVFVFAYVWSICITVKEEYYTKLDDFVKQQFQSVIFPNQDTVYSYFLDAEKMGDDLTIKHWKERTPEFVYEQGTPFFNILVPTIDTARYNFVLEYLLNRQKFTYLTGYSGTGKSVIISKLLVDIKDTRSIDHFSLIFSAQTSSYITQTAIESKLKKLSREEIGMFRGQTMAIMVDDINMPSVEEYGAQPPIELLRLIADKGGFFDRKDWGWKKIINTVLIACSAPPGGGRNQLTPRFTRHFNILNLPEPSYDVLQKIFESMLKGFLEVNAFTESVRQCIGGIVSGSIDCYRDIIKEMKPIPAKFHYTFNLRDVSKVFQGIMMTTPESIRDDKSVSQLWIHEVSRVFHDRLINDEDREWFYNKIIELLGRHFSKTKFEKDQIFGSKKILFSDILRLEFDDKRYEQITNPEKLLKTLEDKLDDYNLDPDNLSKMNLVFFGECIEHILKVARVLRSPRGNIMLIGVGGSGKQSLTKLASYMYEYKLLGIEIKKNYGIMEFRADIKEFMKQAGCQRDNKDKGVVFQFIDTQISQEGFLEDINNMLNSGEVPNLWEPEEKSAVITDNRDYNEKILKRAGDPDTVYKTFVERVRNNLHIVLCMSPVGDALRVRCRKFPSLVDCCCLDWFSPWPADALFSVARRLLKDDLMFPTSDEIEPDTLIDRISSLCQVVHTTAAEMADTFERELKRKVYTTPKSYLDMIKLYQKLLKEKRGQMKVQQNRLQSGLTKLQDASVEVAKLQIQLTELEPELVIKSQQAEIAISQVQTEKTLAEQKQSIVAEETEKVQDQQEKIQTIKDAAQKELDKVLPELQKATQALENIDKSQLDTLKKLPNPPKAAEIVFDVVCTLFGHKKSDWKTAQSLMMDVNKFIGQLKTYDKEHMPNDIKRKLKEKVNKPEFNIESIKKSLPYVADIAGFCKAMDIFADVNEKVGPKQKQVAELNAQLDIANKALAEKNAELTKILEKVSALNNEAKAKNDEKQKLESLKELCAKRLINAGKLINLTKDEAESWKVRVSTLSEEIESLFGDVFLSVGAISYNGPFTSIYRDILVKQWTEKVKELGLPCSENAQNYNIIIKTLGNPMEIREWMIQGLPSDDSSQENSIFTTKGYRWPLLIDPQLQGGRWIKNMENSQEDSSLLITKVNHPKFNADFKRALTNGFPVIIEDVDESLAPSLDPILSKAYYELDGMYYITFGDNAKLQYDPKFRVYFTTKKPNPAYLADVFIKVNVINFTATFEGLNDQLLAQVVKNERPEIEKQRDQNVMNLAEYRKKIVQMEKEILELLEKATSDTILDDDKLIQTLEDSKKTSIEIGEKIAESQILEKEIEKVRNSYTTVSIRGSILFFVIKDLSLVDPMYQYSLQYITKLFIFALQKAEFAQDIPDKEKMHETRLVNLIHSITSIIFTNVCRGLFEKDKLVFSFLIAISINRKAKLLSDQLWSVFLRGAGPFDKSKQPQNPDKNIMSQLAWDLVYYLDLNFDNLKGLAKSIQSKLKPWQDYSQSADPRNEKLPEGWEKLDQFEKMIILKIFRPEKIMFSISDYVLHFMGQFYLESPQSTMDKLHADSDVTTPIIFVLSSGADPTSLIYNFAQKTKMSDQLKPISLGQGQGKKAKILINQGLRKGYWVFLQNCHLAKSFMPDLEVKLENIQDCLTFYGLKDEKSRLNQEIEVLPEEAKDEKEQQSGQQQNQPQKEEEKEDKKDEKKDDGDYNEAIHPDFRLYLTSMPTAFFPVSVLQNGIKLTTEPPRGLRANLKRSWGTFTQQELDACVKKETFNKLVWGLSYFHAIVQERRKFGPLGWNIRYEFNDSDIETAKIVMQRLLEDNEQIPWDSLLFVSGQINYGGRVTDDWDRRCLITILKKFYNTDILNKTYQFSESNIYKVPEIGPIEDYRQMIENLPLQEEPDVFGMHENANISYQYQESDKMIQTILSIQPRVGGGGGGLSSDQLILNLIENIQKDLPDNLKKEEGKKELFEEDPTTKLIQSMSTVLIQEMDKFNNLLRVMRSTLANLKKAIGGEIVMSADLDSTYFSMLNNQVPKLWVKVAYPSLKPLASWITDLHERVAFMGEWLKNGEPISYWMSGMFFPQGFMTGVLQTYSRKDKIAIDELTFRFKILDFDKENLTVKTDIVGVFIHGLYMEGGVWDKKKKSLQDAAPNQMYFAMPVIHFQPVQESIKKKQFEEQELAEKTYECPVYKTSVRAGVLTTTGQSSNFILPVDIPTEEKSPDFWTLRGCALLSQLNE